MIKQTVWAWKFGDGKLGKWAEPKRDSLSEAPSPEAIKVSAYLIEKKVFDASRLVLRKSFRMKNKDGINSNRMMECFRKVDEALAKIPEKERRRVARALNAIHGDL